MHRALRLIRYVRRELGNFNLLLYMKIHLLVRFLALCWKKKLLQISAGSFNLVLFRKKKLYFVGILVCLKNQFSFLLVELQFDFVKKDSIFLEILVQILDANYVCVF